MKLPVRLLVAASVAGASWPAFAQGMDPGEWQITTTMSSPMLPQPQTASQTRCIKKGELEEPGWTLQEKQTGCDVTVKQKSADGYAWDMTCPGMRGSGSVRFTRDSLQGEVRMSGDQGGQKFDMLTRMSGRRVGPCK